MDMVRYKSCVLLQGKSSGNVVKNISKYINISNTIVFEATHRQWSSNRLCWPAAPPPPLPPLAPHFRPSKGLQDSKNSVQDEAIL